MVLFIATVPWFLPGAAVAAGVALVAGGHLARSLRARRGLASLILLSMGMIVSATLTPNADALNYGAQGSRSCDVSRIGPASLATLTNLNDTSLNVILFAPLGISLALLPKSRRKLLLIGLASALPIATEFIQLEVVALDRSCQSADVADNLTGLLSGLTVGWAIGKILNGRTGIRMPDD